MQSAISAAILAGGRASRLGGVDKPLLVVDPRGTRIIDRQLTELSGVADEILIITNEPAKYTGLANRRIPDAIPGAGPLGGIYSALLAATHPHVLIVAGDLPFVRRSLFEQLIAEVAAEIDVVVPRSTRGLEPLCAVYATRVAAAVRERIDQAELKIASLLQELRVRELGPGQVAEYDRDGRLFDNINTPHDYARARDRMENTVEPFEDRITE